jgi:hypothetical protein
MENIPGLSVRAIIAIYNGGYWPKSSDGYGYKKIIEVDIESIKSMIKNDILIGKLKNHGSVKNLGKKTFDEICSWVNADIKKKRCSCCGQVLLRKS